MCAASEAARYGISLMLESSIVVIGGVIKAGNGTEPMPGPVTTAHCLGNGKHEAISGRE